MEAFKPGLGKLGALPCKNDPPFLSTLQPFLERGDHFHTVMHSRRSSFKGSMGPFKGERGIRNPDLPKIIIYSIYSHVIRGVSRMLTQKKEKGKQKHPNEKLNERAQQVGPKPEMACAKEPEKSKKKIERAQNWAPSQSWPDEKGGRGARPFILVPMRCPNNFIIQICSNKLFRCHVMSSIMTQLKTNF